MPGALSPAATVEVPWTAFGEAARQDAEHRARGCARPVRLVGSTTRYRASTGEVIERYSSGDELDGFTWVRCGNRRARRSYYQRSMTTTRTPPTP